MLIIVDSREQAPFAFEGKAYEGSEVRQGKLQTGDYSLAGLEDLIAVERKSLPDLVGCLTGGRERFERELQRARGLEAFCVVVESPWEALARGEYRSRMNPHAACQSVLAFTARYGIPFLFCGSRPAAEYCAYGFLRQFLQGGRSRWRKVSEAHGAA